MRPILLGSIYYCRRDGECLGYQSLHIRYHADTIYSGIITIPLALCGFIFFPNLHQSGDRTWWISENEQTLAVQRMKAIGRNGKQPWTRAKAIQIFTSWHTYLLRMATFLYHN